MKKYKVGICANFGDGKNATGGQVVKSIMVTETLKEQLGKENILILNTNGGIRRLFDICIKYIKMFSQCDNIITIPAQNGVKVFLGIAYFIKKHYGTKLHFIMIGAWLGEMLKKNKLLLKFVKNADMIYPETETMKETLMEFGVKNITILQNFKSMVPLLPENLKFQTEPPFSFCTFSRVMEKKGIEDAIQAVKAINENAGSTICRLDIYGQVDESYKEKFEKMVKTFPKSVAYRGVVEYDKSTFVLKDYFALLFPTHFLTEGHPGTILDAYSAGVPVIAQRWNSAEDIIKDGITGVIYESGNLKEEMLKAMADSDNFNRMKINALNEYENYMPSKIITRLIENLK